MDSKFECEPNRVSLVDTNKHVVRIYLPILLCYFDRDHPPEMEKKKFQSSVLYSCNKKGYSVM